MCLFRLKRENALFDQLCPFSYYFYCLVYKIRQKKVTKNKRWDVPSKHFAVKKQGNRAEISWQGNWNWAGRCRAERGHISKGWWIKQGWDHVAKVSSQRDCSLLNYCIWDPVSADQVEYLGGVFHWNGHINKSIQPQTRRISQSLYNWMRGPSISWQL